MRILREEGCGADCSSGPELRRAKAAGMVGENIMFTSNNTKIDELKRAAEYGAIINLDDITHIPFMMGARGSARAHIIQIQSWPAHKDGGGERDRQPGWSEVRPHHAELFDAYRIMKHSGAKRFGLHTMVASNCLDPYAFVQTASVMFDTIADISQRVGIHIEFLNIGGGIGIPYRPHQVPVELKIASEGIQVAFDQKITKRGLAPLKIFMENGRALTGPHGYLITTAIHEKHIYEDYIGVDANAMADLPRVPIYGAYHHISVLGKEEAPENRLYNVIDSLCENSGKVYSCWGAEKSPLHRDGREARST